MNSFFLPTFSPPSTTQQPAGAAAVCRYSRWSELRSFHMSVMGAFRPCTGGEDGRTGHSDTQRQRLRGGGGGTGVPHDTKARHKISLAPAPVMAASGLGHALCLPGPLLSAAQSPPAGCAACGTPRCPVALQPGMATSTASGQFDVNRCAETGASGEYLALLSPCPPSAPASHTVTPGTCRQQ